MQQGLGRTSGVLLSVCLPEWALAAQRSCLWRASWRRRLLEHQSWLRGRLLGGHLLPGPPTACTLHTGPWGRQQVQCQLHLGRQHGWQRTSLSWQTSGAPLLRHNSVGMRKEPKMTQR